MAILKAKSGIHLDPKNKGTLTKTSKATGKSVSELAHSKNPKTRKRAQFALNAKHFHHGEGGLLIHRTNSYQSGGMLPSNLFKTNKTAFVDSTLNANKNIEWVKRLTQKNTPSIETPQSIPGWRPGLRSTHLMSDDGKGYVFPEVVDRGRGLEYLGTDAEDYARKSSTGIQFPENQGTWFAANGYKQGTGVLKQKQQEGGTINRLSHIM